MVDRIVLTYRDLARFPDDGQRRELLGGEPHVSPAPTPLHQRVVLRIGEALAAYARRSGGEAFVAPVDVVFGPSDVVQPDALYVGPDRLPIVGDDAILGVPSLIIEVVSPASSEIDPENGRKYRLYAANSVPEYWVVYPKTLRFEAFTEPDAAEQHYRTKSVSQDRAVAITLPALELTL